MARQKDSTGTHAGPRIRPYRRRPRPGTRERTGAGVPARRLELVDEQGLAVPRGNLTDQIDLLREIGQHLKAIPDQPLAAQLVANAVQHAFKADLVAVLTYELANHEYLSLAAAGKGRGHSTPSYHRLADDRGLLGKATRSRKTIVANNVAIDPEYLSLEGQKSQAEVIVPLLYDSHIRGALVVDTAEKDSFTLADVTLLEIVADQLVDAWEQAGYHGRLDQLIDAGVLLPTLLETQAVIDRVAGITKQILDARFAFVALLDQDGNFTHTAHSGSYPQLLEYLKSDPRNDPLLQATLNANHPVRMSDTRVSRISSGLQTDASVLTSLLAFPIQLHHISIGAILAFGKQGQSFYSETDESLAKLISSQAATAIESTWLYQELNSTLQTVIQLNQLSTNIIQAEDLHQAARVIAETAFQLGHPAVAGVSLYDTEGVLQAMIELDKQGVVARPVPPDSLIDRTLQSGQPSQTSDETYASRICLPLQTPRQVFGVLWVYDHRNRWDSSQHVSNLQTLTHQASLALERSHLLAQIHNQTRQLESAYVDLETAYDQTLAALSTALDARDRETEGHSSRVARIAARLGADLGLTPRQVKALERGAMLHDLGKIGVSDNILLKPGPLTEAEWESMRQHPEIGARIIENVPSLAETISVLRYHHERWDGSGYPLRLQKQEIPILARIFSVADAFDALISDRPYRKSTSQRKTVDYLQSQSGTLFDPEIVGHFIKMLEDGQFNDLLGPEKKTAPIAGAAEQVPGA